MKYIKYVKVASKCKTVTGKILKKGDEAIRLSSNRTTGEIYIITKEEFEEALSKPICDMAIKHSPAKLAEMAKKSTETKNRRKVFRAIYNNLKDELSKVGITLTKLQFLKYLYRNEFECSTDVSSVIGNASGGWLNSPIAFLGTNICFFKTGRIMIHMQGKDSKEVELHDPNSLDTVVNYIVTNIAPPK